MKYKYAIILITGAFMLIPAVSSAVDLSTDTPHPISVQIINNVNAFKLPTAKAVIHTDTCDVNGVCGTVASTTDLIQKELVNRNMMRKLYALEESCDLNVQLALFYNYAPQSPATIAIRKSTDPYAQCRALVATSTQI